VDASVLPRNASGTTSTVMRRGRRAHGLALTQHAFVFVLESESKRMLVVMLQAKPEVEVARSGRCGARGGSEAM